MKIIFAKNIGFCSGVKRATLIAEKALKEDKKPIQFLGSLVHNEKVIERFKKKGVKFIKSLPEAKPGTLIIQAHGIPPLSKRFYKKLLIRDATCPLVRRVQLVANSLFKKGLQVIIIGDKKHSETKGIKGYTKNKAIIVEDEKQAKRLPRYKKIGLIPQTTQNLDTVNRILKILKTKVMGVNYINTLCPEVQTRQKEIKSIAKKADGILVIGSKGSANTKRLYQISKTSRKPVWWINSLQELKKINLKKCPTLGVVSGTSTPNWEIEEIKKYLKNYD